MLKLLIYSHSFAPQIGGVETIVMALARGLAESADPKQIHVTVATPSPRRTFDDASLPFTVVREPNLVKLVRLFREADIVQLAGPALLPMFLAWVLRKPWELEHHGFQTI